MFSKYKKPNKNKILDIPTNAVTIKCTNLSCWKNCIFVITSSSFLDVTYVGTCDCDNKFENVPKEKIKKLQLYKYELKKNKDGEFYIYGYNPVNA